MIDIPHFSVPLVIGSAVSPDTYLTYKTFLINSSLLSTSLPGLHSSPRIHLITR